MSYALNIAEDGRVLSATYPQFAPKDVVIVPDLPEGDIAEYRYQNGEFIHDPLPKEEPPPTPSIAQRVTALEETTATKDDVNAIWNTMAEAYSEGVQSA